MLKQFVILLFMAGTLAALVAWDRSLTDRAVIHRQETVRVRQFVDESIFRERPIAGFMLETGDGQPFVYLYDPVGLWRSLNVHGVPARDSEVMTILPRIFEGRGAIHAADPDDPTHYGLGTPEMFRLSLLGESLMSADDGDVIFSFEIGRSIPATGGSYVRMTGEPEVWAVDFDLRDVLVHEPGSTVPPMLDLAVIPEAWAGVKRGVGRVRIDYPDGRFLDLFRRELDVDEASLQAGAPAWEWVVSDAGDSFVGDPMQIHSFVSFLLRVEYAGILGPGDRPELGLDRPRAVLTLEPAAGETLQLIIGRQGPRGGVPIFNTFVQAVLEVSPAHLERFLPHAELFLGPERGNPWEQWLRRR